MGGLLPPGVHSANWSEVEARFATNSRRRWLLDGLHDALLELRRVSCQAAFLDGSFVTDKLVPGDYDLCWDHTTVDLGAIDPIFLDVVHPRAAQQAKYRGDLLPNVLEANSGRLFVEFFQVDKLTGKPKGIIALDPRRVN
jgi:hypothetical protein